MKAQLVSGEIVELVKECDCLDSIHTGPHWLHADRLTKQQNQEILYASENAKDPWGAIPLGYQFCAEEAARLGVLIRCLTERGIYQLIEEEPTL